MTRDDYVSLWFESDEPALNCDHLYVEIGPYAARPSQVARIGLHGWHAVCKLPPGLKSGWQSVRLRLSNTSFGNTARVPVDFHPKPWCEELVEAHNPNFKILGVADGKTWESNRVKIGNGGLAIWVAGLPKASSRDDIEILLGTLALPAAFLSEKSEEGWRQVNAMLPAGIDGGTLKLGLLCRGQASNFVDISVE